MSDIKNKQNEEFSIEKFESLSKEFAELSLLSYESMLNEGNEKSLQQMAEFMNAYALIGIERKEATVEQLQMIFSKALRSVIDNR